VRGLRRAIFAVRSAAPLENRDDHGIRDADAADEERDRSEAHEQSCERLVTAYLAASASEGLETLTSSGDCGFTVAGSSSRTWLIAPSAERQTVVGLPSVEQCLRDRDADEGADVEFGCEVGGLQYPDDSEVLASEPHLGSRGNDAEDVGCGCTEDDGGYSPVASLSHTPVPISVAVTLSSSRSAALTVSPPFAAGSMSDER
jgi:hypothetical protein